MLHGYLRLFLIEQITTTLGPIVRLVYKHGPALSDSCFHKQLEVATNKSIF